LKEEEKQTQKRTTRQNEPKKKGNEEAGEKKRNRAWQVFVPVALSTSIILLARRDDRLSVACHKASRSEIRHINSQDASKPNHLHLSSATVHTAAPDCASVSEEVVITSPSNNIQSHGLQAWAVREWTSIAFFFVSATF
jgi:hypothetical protein